MRAVMISTLAVALAGVAAPAIADPWQGSDWRRSHWQQVDERWHNGPRDRRYVDRNEVRESRDRAERERYDLRDAYRSGDPRRIARERRDYARADREYRQDSRDWERRRDWNGGWNNWNRSGYTQGGSWRPETYYRDSRHYQPRQLARNDAIYRGYDGRYYCRRSDGTTGLILGALGGGVLGNIIAPGGSKTLGSILGGGLGAVLGNQVDRGRAVCR